MPRDAHIVASPPAPLGEDTSAQELLRKAVGSMNELAAAMRELAAATRESMGGAALVRALGDLASRIDAMPRRTEAALLQHARRTKAQTAKLEELMNGSEDHGRRPQ